MSEPLRLNEGEALLIIVENGVVTHQTWDMLLPHVEFVRRRVGVLPEGAWVGTVLKVDGELGIVNSRTFYGNQFPAPIPVQDAVRKMFC